VLTVVSGNMLPPSSGSNNKSSKKPAELTTCFMLVSFLVYPSTLNMKATSSSETSVGFQRTIWCFILEDRTLQEHNNIVEYVLKKKTTVEPEKRPLLANGSETTFFSRPRSRNRQQNDVRCYAAES
jgi:hypothetical protein